MVREQIGEGYVEARIDDRQIPRDLQRIERTVGAQFTRLGKKIQDAGKTWTVGVTTPIVAAGVAMARTAVSFEAEMHNIVSLVGVSQKQVNAWSREIIAMAPALGKAPQELAEGLYAVTSAGFDGAEAMDILKTAAKASSAGLGPLATVTDAVTSAVASYGVENLAAAEATDLLFGAVKLGKAEAPQLAAVIGRVAPMAAELGIEFEEVAGALAAMTLQSGDANQAATGLSGIMAKLLKPAMQAKEHLADVGLSVDDLRASVADKGLLQTLIDLRGRFEGNSEALGFIFEDVEAFRGVLSLTGGNVEQNIDIFKQMEDQVGATGEAFDKTTQTSLFQWNEAMGHLSAASITLGAAVADAAIPVVSEFAETVNRLAGRFDELAPSQQTALVGIAAGLAAIGPTLWVFGTMVRAIGETAQGLSYLRRQGGDAITWLTTWVSMVREARDAGQSWGSILRQSVTPMVAGVGIALAVAATAITFWWQEKKKAEKAADEFAATLDVETGAITENTTAHVANKLEKEGALRIAGQLGVASGDLVDAVVNEGDARDRLTEALRREMEAGVTVEGYLTDNAAAAERLLEILGYQIDAADRGTESELRKAEALEGSTAAQDAAAESAGLAAGQTDTMAGAADDAAGSIEGLGVEMEETKTLADLLRDAFATTTGTMVAIDRAGITLQGNLDVLREKLGENGTSLAQNTEKGRENHGAVLDVIEGITGHIQALADDGRKMDEIRPIFDRHVEDFRKTMRAAGATEDQIDALIEQYGLTPEKVETAVKAAGVSSAVAEVDRFKTALAGIGTVYATVGGFASMDLRVSGGRVAEGAILNFADGGFGKFKPGPEQHYAQIARPGDWRVWAEPETGGEAYIPLSPSKRQRSLAIWQETGKRLGVDPWRVHEFAGGGLLSGGTATANARFDITELTKMPDFYPAMGWQKMMDVIRSRFPGLPLISGLRPGAITATGNPSWHGKGRAVDIPPRMDVFNWLKPAADWLELIFSPAGSRQEYRGADHMFSGITRSMHFDHIHAALARGGLITEPTVGLLGENPATLPEIVSPVSMMADTFRSVLRDEGRAEINITISPTFDLSDRHSQRELVRRIEGAVREVVIAPLVGP